MASAMRSLAASGRSSTTTAWLIKPSATAGTSADRVSARSDGFAPAWMTAVSMAPSKQGPRT